MYTETAAFYDLLYARFKDYPAEAQQLAALLGGLHPAARTILDVGCGTGEHARLLAERHGFQVDGLDVEPAFVRIARAKNPGATFWEADMTAFDLGRRYDVVCCLFSAIGYVCTLENVTRTLVCFRRHLAPGGVVVVEPWLTPAAILPGTVYMNTAEQDDLKLCRMSLTEVDGRRSRLHFAYLIGTREGIVHKTEVHELGLFTVAEMLQAFAAAGLRVRHDPEGLYGRGLYVARAASASSS